MLVTVEVFCVEMGRPNPWVKIINLKAKYNTRGYKMLVEQLLWEGWMVGSTWQDPLEISTTNKTKT